jgi:cell surface protein SprA
VTLPNGEVTDSMDSVLKYLLTGEYNREYFRFQIYSFMRMFMTGFNQEVTVRFGALDLVRGEWRRYTSTLDFNDINVADDGTELDVSAVNIQENNQSALLTT